MPPRLFHLSSWIIKHLDVPTTAWWAVRQRGLHPRLANEIQRELRRDTELHSEARRVWNLILEYQSDSRNFSWDHGWFEIKDRITKEGWANLVSSWVSLLDDTGEKFPEVLSAVRRYLVPVERESHWLYQFSRDVGGKQSLTVQHPEAVLELLDAVVPSSAEDIPYELAQILDLIEETEPSLVSNHRFLRLMSLIEQT